MTTDRFEQIKAQYRRWPGDTEPNGNWGADVSWLIDEVDALRVQLAERDEYYRMVINEACQAPDEKHCTCVPALRKEAERLRKEANEWREKYFYLRGRWEYEEERRANEERE